MPRTCSTDPPSTMSKSIHTFRIRRLLSRIHSTLYSSTASCCSGKSAHDTQIQQFRAEIENWRTEIPLEIRCAGEALSLFSTSDWFDMEYNYTILQLYRVQIIDRQAGSPNRDQVFIDCLRAAEGICHSYRRQFLGKPTRCTWSALHELFLAGLTYLHCLWTSPAAREVHRQGQVSSTCTDCTIVLVIIAERWKVAAPYRDIFETLANRTIRMMNDRAVGQPGPLVVAEERNSGNDGDLMQWVTSITDAGVSEELNGLLASLVGDLPPDIQE